MPEPLYKPVQERRSTHMLQKCTLRLQLANAMLIRLLPTNSSPQNLLTHAAFIVLETLLGLEVYVQFPDRVLSTRAAVGFQ